MMACEKLYRRASERLAPLKKYYLENNDQSYCMRLTNTYVILDMIVRTFEELMADHMLVADLDAYLKFAGLTTLFLDTLEDCEPQKPDARCITTKKCTGLSCTRAYDMYTPHKLISMIEAYRSEMLKHGNNGHSLADEIHVTH